MFMSTHRAVLADLGDRVTIPLLIPQALSIGDLPVAAGVGWLVSPGWSRGSGAGDGKRG